MGALEMRMLALVLVLGSLAAAQTVAPPRQTMYVDSRVVVYPAPDGEPLSADYTLEVNGRPVPVYTARTADPPFDYLDHGGTYSFAYFDFSGRVTLTVRSSRMLQSARIRPLSRRIQHSLVDGYATTITLDEPANLSLEPAGRNRPMLIFANPLEKAPPEKSAPNVIYFGPGVHEPAGGVIRLKSGQTLYIAGGAVVKGAVEALDAENVTIRGRGILCGSGWPHLKGPARRLLGLRSCRNVTIEGIMLRGSYAWTLVPENCEGVTIRGVKICGGRVWNDDGINPVNSRRVSIRDCFIRTDDDCIAAKGLNREWGDVDDVRVEHSVLWCDRARVVLLGHESRAPHMRNIVFRDIDVIHFVQSPFVLEPGEEMMLENITFEDVRLEGVGQGELARIRPVINQYMVTKVPGHIRNILFRNIEVTGAPGQYAITVENYDSNYRVEGVSFENVVIGGEPLREGSSRLKVGKGAGVKVVARER